MSFEGTPDSPFADQPLKRTSPRLAVLSVIGLAVAATAVAIGPASAGTAGAPALAPGAAPSASPSAAPSASASPKPSSAASSGPFNGYAVPRKGCFDYADAPDDSIADTFGVVPFPGADDDTEILGVAHRTDAGSVKSFIKVAALGETGPTSETADGDLFTWRFTVGGKDVVVSAGRSGGAIVPVKATVGGDVKTGELKASATFDTKNSFVILSVDQGGLAGVIGSAVSTGVQLTKISESSTWTDLFGSSSDADSAAAAKPEQQVYSVGAFDTCFFPLPGKVKFESIKAVQHSDSFDVGLTFTDATGAGTKGQQVSIYLPKQIVHTATTDSDGFISVLVPATAQAGKQTLTMTFPGDADTGATTAITTVTITVEKSALSLRSTGSGSTRSIALALRDDDRHSITGQRVSVAVGGRTITVETDRFGNAVIKNVKPGISVSATYSGWSNRYYGSRTAITA